MTLPATPSAPAPYEPRPSGGTGRARRADSARQPHDGWTFVLIPPGTGARPHTLHISVRRLRAVLWGGATMAGASVAVMALFGLVLSAAPRLESEARGVELGVLAAAPVVAPAESLATPAVDSSTVAVAPPAVTPPAAPVPEKRAAPAPRVTTRATPREEPRRRPTPPFVGRREARETRVAESDAPAAPAEASGSLVSRLPVIGRITSNFSRARRHPLLGVVRRHQGVDIAAPSGTRITSSASGRVAFAGRKVGYGLVVEIDHGSGVTTRYAHCRSLLVRAGESVAAGATIATVGRTGLASGPHLHYEVLVRGRSVDPLRTSLASLLRDEPVDAPARVPAAAVPATPTIPAPAPAGVPTLEGEGTTGTGTGTGAGLGAAGRDSTRAETSDVGRATAGG